MKSVIEQGFFQEFAFDNKALKTFVEFQICWKRLKSKRCWIQIRTSSHLYSYLAWHIVYAVCSARACFHINRSSPCYTASCWSVRINLISFLSLEALRLCAI